MRDEKRHEKRQLLGAEIAEVLQIIKILVEELTSQMKILENLIEEEVNDGKKYYSVREVAEITGLNRVTVWQKIVDGEIPSIRIGKKYLIPASFLKGKNASLRQS